MKQDEEVIVKCTHFGGSIIPDNLTLPEFVMTEMEKYSDHVAVIDPINETQLTYGKLLKEINELTAGLQNEGLRKHDVVAIREEIFHKLRNANASDLDNSLRSSTNCKEYVTLTMAALRLGAALTTANPSYKTEELVKQFSGSQVKLVFTQPEQLRLMKEVQLHVPSLEKIFLLSPSDTGEHVATIDDLLYRGRTKSIFKLATISPKDDIALILYSSGTTGLPKGVMITHYNLIASLCQFSHVRQTPGSRDKMLRLSTEDTVNACFPMFHIGGLFIYLFWPMIQGARIVIAPRFELEGFLRAIQKYKVVNPETGKCCRAMERGEIWIRGPQVMKGYLHNPQATKATIMLDGFLRTGDIGYYDSEGYFYIVDRLKELIKVRGFQVAPAELEGLILTHRSVADVVVIGIPDTYSGELPRAYVIVKQGHSASEQEIKEHIIGHVARYKELAGGVRFVSELPKTPSGKPLRRVLLEEAKKEINKTRSHL